MTSRTVLAAGAAACLVLSLSQAISAAERPLPPARPGAFPDVPAPAGTPAAAVVNAALPEGRKVYLPMIAAEAKARGLPPEVADAVARVESSYNSGAVGGDGERGMMQVMPPTAAMLGFKGTPEQLAEPATNIRLGVSYLADAWKRTNGDLCRTLMKYRAGHNQERMSALSVEYCRRAKSHLASLGSPLAAGPLPKAEFGAAPGGLGPVSSGGAGPRVRRVAGRLVRVAARRTPRTTQAFWAAHSARIKAIEARLTWKRGGIMAGT